jgi:hypothetical protein
MLTKWFGMTLQANRQQADLTKSAAGASDINIMNVNGTYYQVPRNVNSFSDVPQFHPMAEPQNNGMRRGCWVCLGSGNATPTENDFRLNSIILDGEITISSQTTVYDEDSNAGKRLVVTFTNTTENSITIREIGLYVQAIPYGGTSHYNDNRNFLFDRTLLDTPVTVGPNESATIVYTLYFIEE